MLPWRHNPVVRGMRNFTSDVSVQRMLVVVVVDFQSGVSRKNREMKLVLLKGLLLTKDEIVGQVI